MKEETMELTTAKESCSVSSVPDSGSELVTMKETKHLGDENIIRIFVVGNRTSHNLVPLSYC